MRGSPIMWRAIDQREYESFNFVWLVTRYEDIFLDGGHMTSDMTTYD